MSAQIDGPRLPPASGKPAKQLVIFLHGYGADGNDLIGLGREWARALPDAAFVSPHAPESIPGYYGGRQWFHLEMRGENEWDQGVRKAHPALYAFIVDEAKKAQLPLSAVALVGFSQGTMMALQTGLRLPEAPAAIVGFFGASCGGEATRRRNQGQAAGSSDPWRGGRGDPLPGDPPCAQCARGGGRLRPVADQTRPRAWHRPGGAARRGFVPAHGFRFGLRI